MNFGIIILALMLCGAAVIGMSVLSSASNEPYSDSFGTLPTNQTNTTQGIVTNSTAPLTGAAGGLVILFGFFAVIIAGLFLSKAVGKGMYGQRK